ncbi:hypothetical protein [Rhodoblastus sp.]|uniref:hypothetical protein n=1 Tax=Rhodoblastus sp. TaxID=1962975 RepID=UPI003F998C5C
MHTPHIKPQQNFNYPIGLKSRAAETKAAKTKQADPDLVLPAAEWDRNGKRRDRPSDARRPDDAPENADETFAPSSAASAASGPRAQISLFPARGAGDAELQKLLDAVAGDRPAAPLRPAPGADEPSLSDLLNSAAR